MCNIKIKKVNLLWNSYRLRSQESNGFQFMFSIPFSHQLRFLTSPLQSSQLGIYISLHWKHKTCTLTFQTFNFELSLLLTLAAVAYAFYYELLQSLTFFFKSSSKRFSMLSQAKISPFLYVVVLLIAPILSALTSLIICTFTLKRFLLEAALKGSTGIILCVIFILWNVFYNSFCSPMWTSENTYYANGHFLEVHRTSTIHSKGIIFYYLVSQRHFWVQSLLSPFYFKD